MSIEQEIINWDEKSSSDIRAIYTHHCGDRSFASQLTQFSQKVDLQKGATWLLKHHLESGHKLEPNECVVLFRLLPELEHWETKLHILQCLPFMPIATREKNKVEAFLRECLIDKNKFVRAWAYNGFYVISTQYPEYKEEAKKFFEMAMKDEASSVKARIRNIMKNGF